MPRGEEENRQKKRPGARLRGQGEASDAPFHPTMNLDQASDTNQQCENKVSGKSDSRFPGCPGWVHGWRLEARPAQVKETPQAVDWCSDTVQILIDGRDVGGQPVFDRRLAPDVDRERVQVPGDPAGIAVRLPG